MIPAHAIHKAHAPSTNTNSTPDTRACCLSAVLMHTQAKQQETAEVQPFVRLSHMQPQPWCHNGGCWGPQAPGTCHSQSTCTIHKHNRHRTTHTLEHVTQSAVLMPQVILQTPTCCIPAQKRSLCPKLQHTPALSPHQYHSPHRQPSQLLLSRRRVCCTTGQFMLHDCIPFHLAWNATQLSSNPTPILLLSHG